MKKYFLLHFLVISFVLLDMFFTQAEEVPQMSLRSTYRDLLTFQVQSMSNVFLVNKHNYGFYGHSTIKHNYEMKSINEEATVIDHATGLMWHQSGSDIEMDWKKAKQWVIDLNKKKYAGYDDWRLPTVEEATSLLAMNKNDGDLYIDAVFNIKQIGIWTGDENDSASYLDGAWGVRFSGGYGGGNVCWCYDNASNYVRPVRSLQ
jgi:hypothetical protein